MKPKILFISRKWPPAIGGMETYSVELARGLRELADVRTLVLSGRSDGRAPHLLAYGWFLLKAMAFCSVNARRYNHVIFGDLILFPAALVHRWFNRDASRIVIVYGLDLVFHRRKGILAWLYGCYFSGFRFFQSCFREIVAISNYTASLARAEKLQEPHVINPCLPEGAALPEPAINEALPTVWTEAPGPRVLYYGRLIPRKGALWFARQVLPNLPADTHFFVVGTSADEDYKRQLAISARTFCLGRLPGSMLSSMIRDANLVVMPNVEVPESIDVEGFGLVAIETSALGGRLLASRTDGITDAVVDGLTGTLVTAGDSQAWIKRIDSIMSGLSSPPLPDPISVKRSTRELFSSAAQASAFIALLRLDEGIAHGR